MTRCVRKSIRDSPLILYENIKTKNEVTQLIKNKCKYKFINHDGKHLIKKSVHSNAGPINIKFPKTVPYPEPF